MTIMYGFTKDEGFAIVDTDARCYFYGYPTSDLQVFARHAGAKKAAQAQLDGLRDLAGFVMRMKAHNLGTPYEAQCEQTLNGGYDNVFASLVAPQMLESTA